MGIQYFGLSSVIYCWVTGRKMNRESSIRDHVFVDKIMKLLEKVSIEISGPRWYQQPHQNLESISKNLFNMKQSEFHVWLWVPRFNWLNSSESNGFHSLYETNVIIFKSADNINWIELSEHIQFRNGISISAASKLILFGCP